MSVKKVVSNSKLVAKLVTEEKGPCSFCQRDVDDELIYGKLYAIGNIKCHYFCVLLSCCLVQKGRDEVGLFGFLYPDILAEIERSKKHKCSYCNKEGASLGCSVSQCRKQFHLPCGREKNAVSLFYGSYKSFCQNHIPKQKIAEDVMAKVKERQQAHRKRTKLIKAGLIAKEDSEESTLDCVCVICYEVVAGAPAPHTFWPPCCARDKWLHRTCLQRMALSAGMHYLKCPLCNDKEQFYEAVVSQGYYVPDRDAAWELEQNAFADMYQRPVRCLVDCQCPLGREHDSDSGMWDIKLCLLCGSSGAHEHCLSLLGETRLICALCKAANTDVEGLANTVEAVMATEQAQASRAERRPVMPSRMSLRRTKQRIINSASSSTSLTKTDIESTSREDLNLHTPKRPQPDRTIKETRIKYSPIKGKEIQKYSPSKGTLKDIQNRLLSPSKVIEQLYEKISVYNVDSKLLEEVRDVCRKPKPLSVKKKLVDNLLDNIVNNVAKENAKSKEPLKEWCSPKKCFENAAPSEESSPRKWSKQTTNSPYKSPLHTPKKTTECQLQSPSKSNTENQDLTNNSPLKADNTYNIRNNEDKSEKITSDDESSSSTFQLPPEFIAEDSNDSLPIFETPKLKTVDIQKDSSLEISENDEVVKVDVVKIEDMCTNNDFIKNLDLKSPVKNDKCVLKFSPFDKETLIDNVGFDVNCFKNRYLNEVARDFKCKFKHNHTDVPKERPKIKTPIDFAMEASNDRKRSIESSEDIPKKKRKLRTEKRKKINSEGRKLKGKNKKNKETTDIELVNGQDNLKLSLKGKKKRKKTKVSIKDKEIKVRIQWKKKRLQVKITESSNNKVTNNKVKKESPKLKQYVLKYTDVNETVLEKPKFDVTPMKRKYVKLEKSPDNLKQTSIQNFFKIVLPKQE